MTLIDKYLKDKQSTIVVLHVVPDLRRVAGGIASTVPRFAEALKQQGVESRFLSLRIDASSSISDRVTLPSSPALHLRHFREAVRDALDGLPPTQTVVVHSHGLWNPLNHLALAAAESRDLGRVVSAHGMLLPWARRHKGLRKSVAWHLYQRRDLRKATAVHVTSKAEAELVAETVGKGHVRYVPFGVDIPPAPAPMEFASSERTILFLGRLHPVKNLESLIYAFVRAAPPHWRLRLVGPDEGGYRAQLESLSVTLNSRDRISFAGPMYEADKDRELSAAHALALSSYSENYGAVVGEALALGRPVIASTGTPWSELVTEDCGWWVDPAPMALQGAIAALTALPDNHLAAMGARARTWVADARSWNVAGAAMAAIYREAAGFWNEGSDQSQRA